MPIIVEGRQSTLATILLASQACPDNLEKFLIKILAFNFESYLVIYRKFIMQWGTFSPTYSGGPVLCSEHVGLPHVPAFLMITRKIPSSLDISLSSSDQIPISTENFVVFLSPLHQPRIISYVLVHISIEGVCLCV